MADNNSVEPELNSQNLEPQPPTNLQAEVLHQPRTLYEEAAYLIFFSFCGVLLRIVFDKYGKYPDQAAVYVIYS